MNEEPRDILISSKTVDRTIKMYAVLASLAIALIVIFAPTLEEVKEHAKSFVGWNRALLQDQIEICNKAERKLAESIKGLYGINHGFSLPRLANEAVRKEILDSGKIKEEGESALDDTLLFCSTRPRYRRMLDQIEAGANPRRLLSI